MAITPQVKAATKAAPEAELLEADVVPSPTLDGRYYLIGLNRPAPTLLAGIFWSTAHVLQVTLDACKPSHFSYCDLAASA